MSLVIRLKVPIEMHYTVIPMGTSEVNSSQPELYLDHWISVRRHWSVLIMLQVLIAVVQII